MMNKWREKWSLCPYRSLSFYIGSIKQTNVFSWNTNMIDCHLAANHLCSFEFVEEKNTKQRWKKFCSFSELKHIRICSLICEDFLMVIKWLRKNRKFFKLKSLICFARAAAISLLVEKSNQRFCKKRRKRNEIKNSSQCFVIVSYKTEYEQLYFINSLRCIECL